MKVRDRIEQKLVEALSPSHLEVHDESHMHAGGPDAQSHFRVRVVAAAFEGRSRVQRHQTIYRILEPERAGGVHALGIQTLTPEEYERQPELRIESPACLGGDGSVKP